MKIIVNNKTKEVTSDLSLANLLIEMGVVSEKTLVSINDEVVSPDEFNNTSVNENDSVDLFSFVGGG